jgi:hypothetical protein
MPDETLSEPHEVALRISRCSRGVNQDVQIPGRRHVASFASSPLARPPNERCRAGIGRDIIDQGVSNASIDLNMENTHYNLSMGATAGRSPSGPAPPVRAHALSQGSNRSATQPRRQMAIEPIEDYRDGFRAHEVVARFRTHLTPQTGDLGSTRGEFGASLGGIHAATRRCSGTISRPVNPRLAPEVIR